MSAIDEMLDLARERTGLPSDNALAERLGVNRQLLWQARRGSKPLSDERIAQICALAKLDGPMWIAMIHAEKAQSATERTLWKLMLDRLSAAAAVVALVALSMPGLANAKTAQIQAVSGADNSGMYIMLKASSHRLAPPAFRHQCPEHRQSRTWAEATSAPASTNSQDR